MRKKLFVVLGCLLLLLVGIGIAELVELVKLNTLEPGEIYKSRNVTVVELVNPEHKHYNFCYSASDPVGCFKGVGIVVTGTVTAKQEIHAKYEVNGNPGGMSMTLFDFAVEEYLYTASDAIREKETLRIGSPCGIFNCSDDLPLIDVGKEFLICCVMASEMESDSAHRAEYLDCVVTAPGPLIIEASGSKYVVKEQFADYLTDKDRIVNILQLDEEKVQQIADLGPEAAPERTGVQDPDNLLSVMREHFLRYYADTEPLDRLADTVWKRVQNQYAIEKAEFHALIVDIVKHNN